MNPVWFGYCMASAVWLAFGLLTLAFAPGLLKVGGVPLLAGGVYLGYRAYLEDTR